MFDPELFEAEVDEHFSFLTKEFGFTKERMRVHEPECWIVFSKPDAKIIVSQEQGAACWVALHDTKAEGSGNRVEFGLHELVQEKRKRGFIASKPGVNANLHQEVMALASDLRAVGEDVLQGDFSILRARHARHRSAVSRAGKS